MKPLAASSSASYDRKANAKSGEERPSPHRSDLVVLVPVKNAESRVIF
jgi:hypothetical protein